MNQKELQLHRAELFQAPSPGRRRQRQRMSKSLRGRAHSDSLPRSWTRKTKAGVLSELFTAFGAERKPPAPAPRRGADASDPAGAAGRLQPLGYGGYGPFSLRCPAAPASPRAMTWPRGFGHPYATRRCAAALHRMSSWPLVGRGRGRKGGNVCCVACFLAAADSADAPACLIGTTAHTARPPHRPHGSPRRLPALLEEASPDSALC